MKSRPRSVEREVAKSLTGHFKTLGMSPVERIPILGRTGPDLTINESRLAIDVKSRQCISRNSYLICSNAIHLDMHGLIYVKLNSFPLIYSNDLPMSKDVFHSVQTENWLDHMAEWTDRANTIPAIVLHRPGTWIDNAVFVIYAADREKLKEIYKAWQLVERLPKQQLSMMPAL